MKNETIFERRALLLDAALHEFAQLPYDDASLNTILKSAEVSKGSFYYQFKDKEDLYLHLIKNAYDAKWAFIQEHMQGKTTNRRLSIFDRFREQAILGARFAAQFPLYHRLSVMLRAEKGNPIYARAIEFLGGDTEELLAAMITEAAADGDFRGDVPTDFLVRTLGWLFSHFDDIYTADNGKDLNRMLRDLDCFVDLLQHGIGAAEQ